MKKLLLVVVALASTNAFATRARVNALGNSPHLIDTQTVYSNAADMMMMGDYVTMESGTNGGATEGANTEGMITRSWGDAKMGLSIGHQSKNASVWGLRSAANTALFPSRAITPNQQNPVELSYGMKTGEMAWAGTVVYSNYNDKTALSEKESSAGIRAGLRMGALDAKLNLGLMNTYENATDGKYKGTLGITAGAGYQMDTLYVSGSATMAGFKTETAAGAETRDVTSNEYSVSAVNSMKKDGNEFFYGVGLNMSNTEEKVTKTKTSAMSLPVWMGMEVDAASWLTLRGSVKQNVLISNSKSENATTTTAETAPGVNTTVAALGAGLKFNKLTLDGSLAGSTTQNINGTDLLTQVGLTYMF